jgi:uncharacterized protein
MKELVEFVAKELVDNPDDVRVNEVRSSRATILKLYVHSDDKGWVIGRKGRVANAVRSLLRVAAANENRPHPILEIV